MKNKKKLIAALKNVTRTELEAAYAHLDAAFTVASLREVTADESVAAEAKLKREVALNECEFLWRIMRFVKEENAELMPEKEKP